MKYLLKGHKININFVRMILQYPHLKHKMSAGILDGLCNTHMLGMFNEKNNDDKKKKLRISKLIVLNNRRK